MERTSKDPADINLATLTCLLISVWFAHVLYIPLREGKKIVLNLTLRLMYSIFLGCNQAILKMLVAQF